MRFRKSRLLSLCLFFSVINSASAESKYAAVAPSSPSVPYAVVVYGGYGIETDLETACIKSLKSAIKKCEDAGGIAEGGTSIPPIVDKGSVTFEGVTTYYSYCKWNVSCVFPSRDQVPYQIELGL